MPKKAKPKKSEPRKTMGSMVVGGVPQTRSSGKPVTWEMDLDKPDAVVVPAFNAVLKVLEPLSRTQRFKVLMAHMALAGFERTVK